jgi:hypothetical protein
MMKVVAALRGAGFAGGAGFFFHWEDWQGVGDVGRSFGFCAGAADFDGGSEDGADGNHAAQFVVGDGGEAHGSEAAAGSTVGLSAELAGSDLGLQIRGEGLRGEGEDAVLRGLRRGSELANHGGGHVQLWILNAQLQHFGDGALALLGSEDFGHLIADLGSEEAEPDFFDLRAGGPKLQEFGEIAGALHHLAGDGAMNGDVLVGDIFQDAFVGGGRAADIVFGLEAIHGDGDVQVIQRWPSGAHGAEGAGNKLYMDAALHQKRQQNFQFAKADQGIATDDGKVQGLQAIDDFQNAVDKGLATIIVQFAQGLAAAEMAVFIGVATGTAQGAFSGDFDGEGWGLTFEDFSPRLDDLRSVHRTRTFSDCELKYFTLEQYALNWTVAGGEFLERAGNEVKR